MYENATLLRFLLSLFARFNCLFTKTSFMEEDRLQTKRNDKEAIIHAQKKIDKNDKNTRDNLLLEENVLSIKLLHV